MAVIRNDKKFFLMTDLGLYILKCYIIPICSYYDMLMQ